jgi:hypothetical protein
MSPSFGICFEDSVIFMSCHAMPTWEFQLVFYKHSLLKICAIIAYDFTEGK